MNFIINGNNNEYNGIINSESALLTDPADLAKNNITGIVDICNNTKFVDINGDNHEVNYISNSYNARLKDGDDIIPNNNNNNIPTIEIDPIERH